MASLNKTGTEPIAVSEKVLHGVHAAETNSPSPSSGSTPSINEKPPPPWTWKLTAVVLVTLVRFGGSWSSGITGAMKSTLKKELKINNTQYALLEASEDFMTTLLILGSGLLTDRLGGAGALFYGNIVYSIGAILVAAAAQVRSFNFMIGGRVILAIGDISTQIAQYQVFSAWFAPNNGFGSTLGLELMVAKLGAFTGTSTANIIAVNTGDFAWVYWVAVFINFFTNICSAIFFWFNKKSSEKFGHSVDPVTGEKLMKKGKKLEVRKVLEIPWVFWMLMLYSLCYTSTAIVFSGNATELAEQRFDIDSVTAGWYTALFRYAGFFIVPVVGIFIDFMGQRITLLVVSSFGIFISMALVNWAPMVSGTAAAFGVYAVLTSYNPTVLIDGMRASLWQQSTFGTAYSLKIMMNNAANIIVRIVSGAIQDADDNSYDNVVILYVAMAAFSVTVSCVMMVLAWRSPDLRHLQWSRKQRMGRAVLLADRKDRFMGEKAPRNALISKVCFGLLMMLLLGGWAAYIWGAVTGHNG
ncbi:major facilitator superfamily transporter [Truncatella angustata]|uniref:Lysosomal dipeptide transporter MFSD1 n=1 Tax=Truncatella angustata TaxID=152316 RepID=A0A9P8UGD6_9PEZI|nr:major facilitator superfamily transporter [Truncatella angustata]KAH6651552.1 major facilitator superfamily transporter [Truncatella angustata]